MTEAILGRGARTPRGTGKELEPGAWPPGARKEGRLPSARLFDLSVRGRSMKEKPKNAHALSISSTGDALRYDAPGDGPGRCDGGGRPLERLTAPGGRPAKRRSASKRCVASFAAGFDEAARSGESAHPPPPFPRAAARRASLTPRHSRVAAARLGQRWSCGSSPRRCRSRSRRRRRCRRANRARARPSRWLGPRCGAP